jgi:hypothetical protein
MKSRTQTGTKIRSTWHINNWEHYVGGKTTIVFEYLKGIIAAAKDLTGRIPTTSGNKEMHMCKMVLYDFNSNTINAVAIKNRKEESLIKGYNKMY